ncbi:adenosylcobinamide-GDP ribazoletransferase [Tepidiforma sp.]|uniref:adenosylcobinamide-GDP ribazoletransferase n=1 Tax=Tepidiforma sp. TaxID=2682230 RepID=UPI0021DC2A37|nr:adenosylcobinamide-GDP ribazoletransferase [Tepidiforma sp.]MCX7616334.1 adenosylcobinamide-GDP ribazoletransferase [Tepidiforma sp.]GIW17822.1 MAG: adenosylcobinamide-GDP ribazoletransferase [Tepidiforma sp.]
MSGLTSALGLLTRLPLPAHAWEPAKAARWLPAASIVLAAPVAAAAWGLGEAVPPGAAAAVTVAAWAAATGALHLDGLADCADAAFVPASRERRSEILRDVHHGTFAVAAVGLVLLVKFGCLASMAPGTAAGATAAAIVASRGALPAIARAFPPLGADGMGAAFRGGCTRGVAALGVAAGFGSALLVLGPWGLTAAACAGAAAGLTAWGLSRALGGLNGDAYGACIETAECAALLAAAALIPKLTPWWFAA